MTYRAWTVFIDRDYDSRVVSDDFDYDVDAQNSLIDAENTIKADERIISSKVIPVVTCKCGEEIECINFTNTCSCGLDYNFAGQLLADRSQWGEETGENWTECY